MKSSFHWTMSLTALALLVSLQTPVRAESSTESQAALAMSNGLFLIRANRNEEAVTELRKAASLDPGNAKVYHSLGLALAKLGDNAGAIDCFRKAISLNPNLDSAWLTLGGLYQSLGKLDEALEVYGEFVKRFQGNSQLTDSTKKVSALMQGLDEERKSMKSAREATAALQAGYQIKQPLLNVPTQSLLDDYLPEATRKGIVRWPSNPIKVHIPDSRKVVGYKPEWGTILMQSFRDWEKVSNGLIKFEFVDSIPQQGLECFFYDASVKDPDLVNDAEAGEALMYTLNGDLHNGTIKILTRSSSSVLPLTDNRIRFICLHEIGHALGLSGHTDNPDDVMFLSTSFRDEWKELSARDARTIQRLYMRK